MSAGCVRWLLSHTVRAACRGGLVYGTPTSRFLMYCGGQNVIPATWGRSSFSSEADDVKETPATTKKKQDLQAHGSIVSVGRKIPHKEIQVVSDTGENLGVMHSSKAIRLMDTKNLKLVLLHKHKDPPVYQLMSGKQIHEEQMKLWGEHKAKAASVQLKELTFKVDIAPHDLTTKQKQLESWLEKRHHVRLTLLAKRNKPVDNLDSALGQIVEQMSIMVAFVSQPKVKREGRTATCTVRPLSKNELLQKRTQKAAKPSEEAQSETPVGNKVTPEECAQQ
ncbi:translation initiation factor IF-3, mitochondrial [Nematolebias whitei]|uniref:translation initiation factor IF-3, mitochondrial n=1 Tax=Nematolebias whitei TaxID=451745 RepID=UPI001897F15A|nr:translation initiation factor IF-3, mitochondrial [Nematolebias whitei]